jgi:hypothetical protein
MYKKRVGRRSKEAKKQRRKEEEQGSVGREVPMC